MLDSSDPQTFSAIGELCDIARAKKKPLVFWIGAGASAWAGLPTWGDLAERFCKEFSRYEPSFDRVQGYELFSAKNYPRLFGACKNVSPKRYASLLHDLLKRPSEVKPVFHRFVSALTRSGALRVVTTNVDEVLDHALGVETILPNGMEMIHERLAKDEPFLAKIHGTIADASSVVFTDEEYRLQTTSPAFLSALNAIFHSSTVIFIGYSLKDEYVVKSIADAEKLHGIFGSGPHFACLSHDRADLPTPVRNIRYKAEPHKDHRSAIQVLEEIAVDPQKSSNNSEGANPPGRLISAHLLAECIPAGTWQSSHTLGLDNGWETHVGNGWITSELPFHVSTALHDLAVGLICFDRVYVPVDYLSRVHDMVGGQNFATLIRADVLRFVYTQRVDCVIFRPEERLVGQLSEMSIGNKIDDGPLTGREVIKKQIAAIPGKEVEAGAFLEELERKIVSLDGGMSVTDTVHGLLLRPSIRQMLGMSGGTKVSAVPKWMVFPILRLAGIVRLGAACRSLDLGSVKFGMGNDRLAAPVFAAAYGKAQVEGMASYVVAGNFETNLGSFIEKNPAALDGILRFRDTKDGQTLREEVLAQLSTSAGGDVAAAINGGLRRATDFKSLQQYHNSFARLFVSNSVGRYPALWMDSSYSDNSLRLWRARTTSEFEKICTMHKLKPYDLCPCGSGEHLKFCCLEALKKQPT